MFCIICDWTTYEEQGLTEATEAMEDRQKDTKTFLDLARSIVEGEIIVVPPPILSYKATEEDIIWVARPPSEMEGIKTTFKVLSEMVSSNALEMKVFEDLQHDLEEVVSQGRTGATKWNTLVRPVVHVICKRGFRMLLRWISWCFFACHGRPLRHLPEAAITIVEWAERADVVLRTAWEWMAGGQLDKRPPRRGTITQINAPKHEQEQVQTPTPEVEKEKAPEESIREVITTPDQSRQVEREEQLPEVEAPGVDLNIPIQQEEEVLTQDPQPEIDQTPTTIRNTIRRAGAVVAGNTEITTATTRDSGTTSATRRPNNEARTAITRARGNPNRESRTTRNRTFTTKSGRRGDKESDLTSFGEGKSEERTTVTTRAPPKGETNRE